MFKKETAIICNSYNLYKRLQNVSIAIAHLEAAQFPVPRFCYTQYTPNYKSMFIINVALSRITDIWH